MATSAAILREIHRLRRHAKNLQEEIDRVPRLLKGALTKLSKVEELSKQAHEELKHVKVTIHEKEVDLKTTQQQIIKHEQQMNSASSKKEYDAFKTEIATDKARCQQLEDEILHAMMDVDERTAKFPEFDKAIAQAKKEYQDYDKESQARLGGLKEQLQKAQADLKEVELGIPLELRAQYDRLVIAMGEDAMSAVRNRCCTACYTEITAQKSNELAAGSFVMCKSCGRILYPADEG